MLVWRFGPGPAGFDLGLGLGLGLVVRRLARLRFKVSFWPEVWRAENYNFRCAGAPEPSVWTARSSICFASLASRPSGQRVVRGYSSEPSVWTARGSGLFWRAVRLDGAWFRVVLASRPSGRLVLASAFLESTLEAGCLQGVVPVAMQRLRWAAPSTSQSFVDSNVWAASCKQRCDSRCRCLNPSLAINEMRAPSCNRFRA